MKLSVVVPIYNEEDGIVELHRRCSSICQKTIDDFYELIFVNDGSQDRTWQILVDLAQADRHVVAVNLSRNYGHQAALSAGLSISQGSAVFILDADLQDPPELLDRMLAKMDEGFDVVYGQRTERHGESFFKRSSAFLFYRLLGRIVDVNIPNDTGDFRLMSRRAVDLLNSMPERHRFIRGMVSWIGLRQAALPYERHARYAGETKYPLKKMLLFALSAITSFSIRPLRAAMWLGFGFGVAMVFVSIYALLSFFLHRTVEGWTSLALITLGAAAVQLCVIGVMGEYIGRIYDEVKGRPLFVIESIEAMQKLSSPRVAVAEIKEIHR